MQFERTWEKETSQLAQEWNRHQKFKRKKKKQESKKKKSHKNELGIRYTIKIMWKEKKSQFVTTQSSPLIKLNEN